MAESDKRIIFLAIPFKLHTEKLLHSIGEAVTQSGYQIAIADKPVEEGSRFRDVIRDIIAKASLVIADVSEPNPNVMWELGYAQALNKPVFILAKDPANIPFDLKANRALIYHENTLLSNLVSRILDGIQLTLSDESGSQKTRKQKFERFDKVFFSYSHVDAEYLDRMLIHLRPIERAGAIDLWSDTKLKAGDQWREEIRKALAEAQAAVLLISADFLASEFVITDELPPLLVSAEEKGVRIIPVIVKPSRFLRDNRIARFHSLNDPNKPLISMNEAEREELYARLAELIEGEIGYN